MSVKFLVALLASFALGGLAAFLIFPPSQPSPSPLNAKQSPLPLAKTSSQTALGKIIDETLAGTTGTYGVYVKNLQTGESYGVNETTVFEAASLYKVWVMVVTYEQIAQGKLALDQTLSAEVADLNAKFAIATESAERTQGQVAFRIEDALEQMIVISHNYAALLLSQHVGLGNVRTFLKNHQLSQSSVGQPPKTTAYDMALFFEKLYQGKLANGETTAEMLATLKRQTLNRKIPRFLPTGTMVAHKTGELDYFSHDVGIIYGQKGNYLVAVLSQSDFPPGAEERIGKIAQAVYNYFEK